MCQRKEVMCPLWADPWYTLDAGWTTAVRGWSPQPHLNSPSPCKTKRGPNSHSLLAHLIRKTFPGTWAQNKPSFDSSPKTWEGKAEGHLQGLVTGDSSGFLPHQVNIKTAIVWKVRPQHQGSILGPGHLAANEKSFPQEGKLSTTLPNWPNHHHKQDTKHHPYHYRCS